MISYGPLAKTIQERNIKRTDLIEMCDISTSTLAKLGKNESVTLTIIEKICKALKCNIEDVVEIINEEGEEND